MSQQLKKKFIGNDQVDGDKLLLEDGQAIRAMDGATEVDLAKIASSEVYLNGFKVLESTGLIPAARLPSYVDDVLEFADLAAFPVSGEAGKIYIALDTNKQYRWSGSVYVQITSGAVDSVNGETGVVDLDAGDIKMVSSPTTSVETKLVDLQAEIDDTQNGAGLETDGSYVAPAVSNYLSIASSLKDADSKLDSQIKTVADDLSNHLGDTADAHDASAISISAITNIVAVDVQGALAEIQGQLDTVAGDFVDTAGDTMTGQLTMDHADIFQDYSDVGAGLTQNHSFAEGEILSTYADASESWNTQIFAGGEILSRVSVGAATSDVSITLTTTDLIDPLSIAISNFSSEFSTATKISQIDGSLGIIYVDDSLAGSGESSSANYSSSSASMTINHADSSAEAINIDSTGVTVTAISSIGGFSPIAPSTDYHLTSKKYVDDQDAAQATALSNHLSDTVDAHDASAISFPASGNIIADNVQAAIQELDAEKVKKSGDTMSGLLDITLVGQAALEVNDIVIGEPWGAGSSVVTVKDGSTDDMYIQSADQLAAFAGNVSKEMVVGSGYTSGANSGQVSIVSGIAAVSGTSGAIFARSASGIGATGFVTLKSGDSSANSTGTAVLRSGDAAVNSGVTQVRSGAAVANSGNTSLSSGTSSGGVSGQASLFSGNVTAGTGASGLANISSGSSFGGNSGQVQVLSGAAASGVSGDIILSSGTGATRGLVQIDGSKLNMLTSIDMNSSKITELLDPTSNQDAATKKYADDQDDLRVAAAGDTMTGFLTLHADPTAPLHAATKQYVDAVAEGLHVHTPARLLANVDLGGTYDNGTSGVGAFLDFSASPVVSIDGTSSFSVGDRIILAKQNGNALDAENGIYYIADAADINISGEIVKLTRSIDFDTPTEAAGGDFIFVQHGSNFANTGWVETETVVSIGTTAIRFLQFSGAGSYTAGDGLSLLGGEFSVDVDQLVGDGIQNDGSNNFAIKLATNSGLSVGVSGLTVDATIAGNALDFSAGILAVNVGDGIQISGDAVAVVASDLAGTGLQVDGFNNLELSSSIGGDGLSYSAGILAVNVGDGLQISADTVVVVASDLAGTGLQSDGFNNLELNPSIAGLGLSYSVGVLEVSAGNGIEISGDAVAVKLDADSALAVSLSGLKVDTSIAGNGLDMAAGIMSVNVSDIAGDGLENDGSDNLRIKKEFSTIPDISVSPSGLSVANRWGKEAYTVVAADDVLTFNRYDLDFEIEPNSLVAFVDRLGIHQGAGFDYTLTVEGGVTRVTFLNTLITIGQQKLAAGDQLFFTYQKKAS